MKTKTTKQTDNSLCARTVAVCGHKLNLRHKRWTRLSLRSRTQQFVSNKNKHKIKRKKLLLKKTNEISGEIKSKIVFNRNLKEKKERIK